MAPFVLKLVVPINVHEERGCPGDLRQGMATEFLLLLQVVPMTFHHASEKEFLTHPIILEA
jgi:hypothetical protein